MINGFGYDLLFDFNTHTLHQHVIKFSKEICTSKIFRFYSKQGQQQNKEVMSGLDSDDETDSDGTVDDKYNLCKEKGPSRRSLAIQSGCKVNRHYLLS